MKARKLSVLAIAAAMFLSAANAPAAIPPQERAALEAIYRALDGPNWKVKDNWLGAAGSECTWAFVTCDAAGSTVTSLGVSWNNARGVLPREIGDLNNLEVFSGDGSTITGPMPPEIGRLTKLRILDLTGFYDNLGLTGNDISGALPREMGQLVNLRELKLTANQITAIPQEIGSLPNLEVLDLSYNPILAGPIPPSFMRMPKLKRLLMVRTNRTGAIPPVELPEIVHLWLSENQLTGEIPAALGQSRNLTELRFYGNGLTGSIPASLNQLTELTTLDLGSNSIEGTLPTLSNLTKLKELILFRNRLSGPLPSWIGQLRELTTIWISDNALSGALPAEFFTLAKLAGIEIGGNRFSGNLADFGKFTAATNLYVGGNDFRGPFPLELTRLENLQDLDLSDIPLGGTIPPDIRLLRNLGQLNLQRTNLTGPIPEEFGELTQLAVIVLRQNGLTKLPVSLDKLTNLVTFSVADNQFSGRIPSGTFGKMTKLVNLSLAGNRFDGPIPPDVFSPLLYELYLNDNQLSGAVPSVAAMSTLRSFDLSDNQLTSLPDDLGSMKELREFRIARNEFAGAPPASLGDLTKLESLKMEGNHFSGPLPNLSKLTSLGQAFLHGNQFSGAIPDWLGTLTSLRELILSSNKLSGNVPASITNLKNLRPTDGIWLDNNALTTDSPAVRSFLDSFSAGWDRTQTIAPTDVRVTAERERSITLSWTPIRFSSGPGGYQIAYSKSASGPFDVLTTTPNKSTSTFIADGLDPSTSYFFAVSTVSYPIEDQQNVVTSNPSPPLAVRTTTGAPAPASVVVFVYPYEIYQRPGESGTSAYIIGNVGDLPAVISLSGNDSLFTQELLIRGKQQLVGAYTGNAVISGNGVPQGLAVRVSLLVTEPPAGVCNAQPSANRIDVAARVSDTATGTVDFTNTGSATLQGIVVSNVAWIIPPTGLIVIPPGQTQTVTFTVDQSKRPDASSPAGAVIGTLTLSYQTGNISVSQASPASSTKTTAVTVVYTITPPVESVNFPPFAAGEIALFVAGAGNVTGVKGRYISDVSIVNVFGIDSPKDIRMYYTPANTSASTKVTEVKQLEPNQGVTFADVVKSVFENENIGTIQIRTRSLEQLFVNANIFNVTDRNGTYGTALPIFRSDRALRAGESLFLTGLRRDAERSTYTNMFIQETSGGIAGYEIEFFDAAGKPVGEKRTGGVDPFRLAQLNDAVPLGALAARITNAADSGGRIVAYATPIDNVSGDFWTVADWNRELGAALDEPVIIPVAGSVHGRLNTFFRTDLSVTNRSASGGSGTLTFFDRGGPTRQRELALTGSQSLVLGDIVGTSFPDLNEPLGYLEFEPHEGGTFSLTSRTFATQPGIQGTFGTGVPVLPRSAALRLGQSKIITGLDVASPQTTNAGKPGTFRTNIGIIEISGKPATVEVTVVYADIRQLISGIRLTTLRYEVGPHGSVNKSLAEEIRIGNPNVSDLRSVQLKFRVVSGEGAVIAYTSSVDNGTQDQVLRVQ